MGLFSLSAESSGLDIFHAEEFVTVTNFWGAHEEFQLRAVWIQNPHQLFMRRLQVIERKAKV